MANNWGPETGQLERVTSQLIARHGDDKTFVGTCSKNGCWDVCYLKGHLGKDGKVCAVETDNTVHSNHGREDEYCDFSDFEKGIYQKRACTRGRLLRSDVESETRILYPMRRVGPKGPGATFERISWEEALDEIARMYTETREKYGPYSVYADGMMGESWDPFARWTEMGGGVGCWGEDSYESSNFADDVMYGQCADWIDQVNGIAEVQTYFDTELILQFGIDTAINFTERVYYELLAKERGVPIIIIDPRMTWTAQTIATQWIPIKPGTDMAMIMAMTQVIFEEDLWDHEFVEKFVEPVGFEKYRKMIMGENEKGTQHLKQMTDGELPKTPEWAEAICGVPAETIRELARLYAKSRPAYIRMVWAATRQIHGKDTARAFNVLQCICGNLGKRGCAGNCTGFGRRPGSNGPYATMFLRPGQTPPHHAPVCMEAEAYNKAILLHPKMEAGEITKEEYCYEIGCSTTGPIPNIHMILDIPSNRNYAAGWYGVNERLESLRQVDYFVYMHWNLKNITCTYADIVLPQTSSSLESPWNSLDAQFGTCNGINPGTQNHFIYGRGMSTPPGETRYTWWIIKEIAKRLGIADTMCPVIKDATPEEIGQIMEDQAVEAAYNAWCGYSQYAGENPPSWEEFKKTQIHRWEEDWYWVYAMDHIQEGKPFKTKSGKIEFYNEFLADWDLTKAHLGASERQLGSNNIKAMPIWRKSPQGMESVRTKDFPLYMVTPHSFYRQHTAFDHSDWVRDEHRNSVWISVADAKARGIKDGDNVRIYSDCGECWLPAYVTSRLVPGVCCLIFGRWYEPNGIKTDLMPDGIDLRGDCNLLISDDHYGDVKGSILCNALVEIEKADTAVLVTNAGEFIQGSKEE